jgi:2-C-methyl-D-erythritol 4-phosphate cytidylyltransferase
MFNGTEVGAVIVGAGKGERMGGIDKMFMSLEGRPVLAHSAGVFEASPLVDRIILVLHPSSLECGKRLVEAAAWSKVQDIVSGGLRRQDSVKAGLVRLADCRWLLIHDGARPLVTPELIQKGLEAAQETGAAICAVPVVDTIKTVAPDGLVSGTPERSRLWSVQTPQVFRSDIIKRIYLDDSVDVTDDAALAEQAGYRVRTYMGSYDNIKLTTPVDIDLAEILLRRRRG